MTIALDFTWFLRCFGGLTPSSFNGLTSTWSTTFDYKVCLCSCWLCVFGRPCVNNIILGIFEIVFIENQLPLGRSRNPGDSPEFPRLLITYVFSIALSKMSEGTALEDVVNSGRVASWTHCDLIHCHPFPIFFSSLGLFHLVKTLSQQQLVDICGSLYEIFHHYGLLILLGHDCELLNRTMRRIWAAAMRRACSPLCRPHSWRWLPLAIHRCQAASMAPMPHP